MAVSIQGIGSVCALGSGIEPLREGLFGGAAPRREAVEMPITEKINEVLFKGRDPLDAVRDLMTRNPKQEHRESNT